MLARPRALESLYLGESRAHSQREDMTGDLLATDQAQTSAALEQQGHSLQRLVYRPLNPQLLGDHDDSVVTPVGPVQDNFNRVFENLSQLRSFFIDSELRQQSPLQRAALTAAPQLRRLTVTHRADPKPGAPNGVAEYLARMWRIYRLAQRCMDSNTLQQLEVRVLSCYRMAYFRNYVLDLVIEAAVDLLHTKDIGFRIFFQRIDESQTPPFLYLEIEPRNYLLFDSEAGGWQLWVGVDVDEAELVTESGEEEEDDED